MTMPTISTPDHITFSLCKADENTFECRGFVFADQDGGFCAYSTNLPGVYGEGDTAEAAFSDLCEAFRGIIQSYLEDREPIPWRTPYIDPELTGIQKWAMVNVVATAVR